MTKKLIVLLAASLAMPFTVAAESEPVAECSSWACVCACQLDADRWLLNPETGTPFFYPGGSKDECPRLDGAACIGTDIVGSGPGLPKRGKLVDCEWTLVPADSGDEVCTVADLED